MLLERLQERCPSAQFVGSAYVCGYELRFSKRSKDCSGKATIVESKGNHEKLYGALFQIEKAELPDLDKAEGSGYERRDDFVVVKMADNEEIEVTTYFAKPGATGEFLKPYGWYKQLVLWAAVQAKLPASYLAKLVAIEADRDTDCQRNNSALGLLNDTADGVFSEGNWDMKIADQHTVADWKAMKTRLDPGNPDNWEDAFNLFFRKRIETRYFSPIKQLIKEDKKAGEGFAIVALQCSLIEFLASTRTGQKYKHCPQIEKKKNIECGPHEYCHSSKLFIDFLYNQKPFKAYFKSKGKADYFYENVRCALLHEARTTGGWKIRVC